jgi:pimeloyl-ACP methyl ester carboxylesterase
MTRIRTALAAVLVVLLAGVVAAPAAAHGRHRDLRPVIFVHGGAGSGAQFETQALRLTSNGYPSELIGVHEYDSTFGLNTMDQVWSGLDALIAQMLDDSGADQVDLLGHSLGTTVVQGYLTSSPERAAKVAHYVNIDGRTATALPGGVPTLAVWGEGSQTRTIVGAQNYYAPNQSHVQVATAAETFAQFYEFFTGRAPRTTQVRSQGHPVLSGEANLFPSNVGAAGTTLEIWELDARTGFRRGRHPKATFAIGADGAWGPFRASSHKRYELALVSPTGSTHHFYAEPFRRSDHLVRLLTTEPGTGLDLLREKSDRHSSLTIVRYKEWWGDQGAGSDGLAIDGTSILNAANAPRTKRVNAIFAFDIGSDGVTDLTAPHPVLFSLPFLTGIDVFIAATTPTTRTVRVEMTSRTAGGETAAVAIPNWPSSSHHSTVQFRDDG